MWICLKNFGMNLGLIRSMLDLMGLAKNSPMPNFANRSFQSQFQRLKQEDSQKSVVFFPGCYINYYDPGTGFDLIWLLRKAGYKVIVPQDFVCCGLPLISNGFGQDAKQNASQNAKIIAKLNQKELPVLTACPSCRLMLSRELKDFFPEISEASGPLKILDAEAFLLSLIRAGELPISSKQAQQANFSAIYHAPCHLRAQGEGLPALELLNELPNLDIIEANAGCCGISGSYGFKKEKYAISQLVGHNLFQTIKESGKPMVLSECGTCRLQIGAATKLPTIHPLSLLRAALEGRQLRLSA